LTTTSVVTVSLKHSGMNWSAGHKKWERRPRVADLADELKLSV